MMNCFVRCILKLGSLTAACCVSAGCSYLHALPHGPMEADRSDRVEPMRANGKSSKPLRYRRRASLWRSSRVKYCWRFGACPMIPGLLTGPSSQNFLQPHRRARLCQEAAMSTQNSSVNSQQTSLMLRGRASCIRNKFGVIFATIPRHPHPMRIAVVGNHLPGSVGSQPSQLICAMQSR